MTDVTCKADPQDRSRFGGSIRAFCTNGVRSPRSRGRKPRRDQSINSGQEYEPMLSSLGVGHGGDCEGRCWNEMWPLQPAGADLSNRHYGWLPPIEDYMSVCGLGGSSHTASARAARVGRAYPQRGGRAVEQVSEIFVGLDVAKAHHAVAIAEGGRSGEIKYSGEIDSYPNAVRRMVARLEKRHRHLDFRYEAEPTGYGLYRQLNALGHQCTVVAPTLNPQRSRAGTTRRDAIQLAKLLPAGGLTAVWVPDETHETNRELV